MGFRALLSFVLTAAGSAWAGEEAVLANGGRLHAKRHESAGSMVRLYIGDGYVEIQATRVLGFEPDELSAPPVTEVPETSAPPVSPRQFADAADDKYRSRRGLVRTVPYAESRFHPPA